MECTRFPLNEVFRLESFEVVWVQNVLALTRVHKGFEAMAMGSSVPRCHFPDRTIGILRVGVLGRLSVHRVDSLGIPVSNVLGHVAKAYTVGSASQQGSS